MNHNYAIENHVAEGYLLDELDETERDAYEDHYFGCTTCAEEVEIVSEFIDTAKQVIREESRPKPVAISTSPNWFRRITAPIMHPLPAAAFLFLAMMSGVAAYQYQVTIPRLQAAASPQIVESMSPLKHARGDISKLRFSKGKSFSIPFDIPEAGFSSYQVSILATPTNAVKVPPKDISAEDAKKALEILVPAGTLDSGHYLLLIEGINGTTKGEVDRIPFELELQD